MRIELSCEQERVLLAWAEEHRAAEVAADCEPSGYDLIVSVSPYGIEAEARAGSRVLDLGSVPFLLTDRKRMRQSCLEAVSCISRGMAQVPAEPGTIDAVLGALRAAWLANPSLSLVQVLINAARLTMPVAELDKLANEDLQARVDRMRSAAQGDGDL